MEEIKRSATTARRASFFMLLGLFYMWGWEVGDTMKHHSSTLRVVVAVALCLIALGGAFVWSAAYRTFRSIEDTNYEEEGEHG